MSDSTPERPKAHRALAIAYSAAFDPTMPTEALRIYLGNVDIVWGRRVKEEKVAYLGLDTISTHSGVDRKTIPAHLDHVARLGMVQVDVGQRGQVVDGHGLAAAWDACDSTYRPWDFERAGFPYIPSDYYLDLVSKYLLGRSRSQHPHAVGESCTQDWLATLAKFHDPGSDRWRQKEAGSSGWRLAIVLIAVHGLSRTSTINTSNLAETLGKDPSVLRRTLQRLEPLGLVVKDGRRWVWDPTELVMEHIAPDDFEPWLTDNRVSSPLASRRWLHVERPEWVERKQAEAKARDLSYYTYRPIVPREVREADVRLDETLGAFGPSGTEGASAT